MAFEAINTAKQILETAHSEAVALAASKVIADAVAKYYQLGYGQKLVHAGVIRSVEDLPRWDTVPDDVRKAMESYFGASEDTEDGDAGM